MESRPPRTDPRFEWIRQPHFAGKQGMAARLEFVVFTVVFEYGCFVRDPDAVVAESREDGPAGFSGQHLWRKHSSEITWEIFDEKRHDVSCRVRHRRRISPLLPNLIERGKRGIAAYQQVLVFLFAALHSLHQHGRGETSVL